MCYHYFHGKTEIMHSFLLETDLTHACFDTYMY